MLGWAALPFALTLIVLGTVMMLRRYAGYWSAEALVGIELVLLCGMVMTHLLNNDSVNWTTTSEGYDGGMVGWATGNLLAAGLGRWPAFVLMLALAFIGVLLLVRYTPMIYGVHYTGRLVPVVPAILGALWSTAWPKRQPHVKESPDPRLPGIRRAASFVSATEDDDLMVAARVGCPGQSQKTSPSRQGNKAKSARKSTRQETVRAQADAQCGKPSPPRSAGTGLGRLQRDGCQ